MDGVITNLNNFIKEKIKKTINFEHFITLRDAATAYYGLAPNLQQKLCLSLDEKEINNFTEYFINFVCPFSFNHENYLDWFNFKETAHPLVWLVYRHNSKKPTIDKGHTIYEFDQMFYNEKFFSFDGFNISSFILVSIYLLVHLIFTSMSSWHDYLFNEITYYFHFWHLNFTHGYYLRSKKVCYFYYDRSNSIIINDEVYFNIPFFTNRRSTDFYLADISISILSIAEIGFFSYHRLLLSHTYIRTVVFSIAIIKLLFFVNDVITLFFSTKHFFNQWLTNLINIIKHLPLIKKYYLQQTISLLPSIISVFIALTIIIAVSFGLIRLERTHAQQEQQEKEIDLTIFKDLGAILTFLIKEKSLKLKYKDKYQEQEICLHLQNETLSQLINQCNNETILTIFSKMRHKVLSIKDIIKNNNNKIKFLTDELMKIKMFIKNGTFSEPDEVIANIKNEFIKNNIDLTAIENDETLFNYEINKKNIDLTIAILKSIKTILDNDQNNKDKKETIEKIIDTWDGIDTYLKVNVDVEERTLY